ncbi:MAG: TIGR03619 family F420-dependent LLM class oxidoreductase [bacterium]|nr:LLM class F420-dependent oxidoreductase [Deltaproteobacteria bacterium]MCP4907736.1 TIGR03619 family F420-dependent LLM class oxidoreductase [bacterium]
MQFWQSLPFLHPDELLELAPVCEEAGFEGINLADHLFAPEHFVSRYPYDDSGEAPFNGSTPFPEAFATIAALSQVTTTLRFLTNVYILPLRHPIEIAKDLGTAAIFSKNRAVLGFGAGWLREEFEIMGVPFEQRGRRMDEQLPIIQRLLAGEVVEAKGEFYQFNALRMNPVPTAKVPMWVGGMNKAALRRAAQFGDGWTGAGSRFEETLGILAKLRELRARFGREKAPFDCLIPLIEQLPPEQMTQLVDLGMTATVSWPLEYQLPPGCTLEDKKAKIRELGETMIKPVNG